MPIYLDDISSITNAKPRALGPKFFCKDLTGNGKTTGLINDSRRPGRYPVGQSKINANEASYDKFSRTSANDVTTRYIPMGLLARGSVLTSYAQNAADLTLPVPDLDEMFHVNAGRSKNAREVYVNLTPQGMRLTEDGNGDKIMRNLSVLYRMEIFVLDANSTAERVTITNDPVRPHDEAVLVDWSTAPLDDIEDSIAEATLHLSSNHNGIFVDIDDLAQWMADYDLYDRVCSLAEAWAADGIADEICNHIEEVFAQGTPSNSQLNVLVAQLHLLESYAVSLDSYLRIHQTIEKICPADIAEVLVKQNLNLLMGSEMGHLDAKKTNLPSLTLPQGSVFAPKRPLSKQQRDAVETDDPLALVLSAAGTGKSTTILARIEYALACGVPIEDITVLSFTNAAADNIREKHPGVGSMTIAKMIHDIYTLNHPNHGVSQIDTILNSFDIFFPQSDLAHAMRELLKSVDKNEKGSYTALNNFVEKYYEEVMELLDAIGQTCLELQIIIAYQRIDEMIEPPHVQSRHLIVDEVQDNSIFEFIYILKYVAKHEESLFIVGDASQTLYEFRASNPRALNTLENSGIFANYQLTTNYRSNQEVLDFANVHLADIDANRTAKLRLQANSLTMPTADSFQEKVTLDYHCTRSQKEFLENYEAYLQNKVGPWIKERLDRGEQVAFLMHTRNLVARTEEKLKEMYPSEQVANLVGEKMWATTVFSQFVKMYWNDVKQVPDVGQASFAISKGIQDNLANLVSQRNIDKTRKKVVNMIVEWWSENVQTVDGWVSLHKAGQLSREGFFDQLRQNLLDYEIEKNAIRQRLNNHKNRERKEANINSNARLVVSTIHSAKGLEFDHVVVVHKFSSQMEEADKRMFYVAFTRAMKSEYILSNGSVKKPRIQSDYDLVVEALDKRDKLAAMRAQGYDVDAMSDDEAEAALATFVSEQESADDAEPTNAANDTVDTDSAPAPSADGVTETETESASDADSDQGADDDTGDSVSAFTD